MKSKNNKFFFYLKEEDFVSLNKINFKHDFLKQLIRLITYFKCKYLLFKFKKYVEYDINLHIIII